MDRNKGLSSYIKPSEAENNLDSLVNFEWRENTQKLKAECWSQWSQHGRRVSSEGRVGN